MKKKPIFKNSRLDNTPEIDLRGDIGEYDGKWVANQIKNAYDTDYKAAKVIRININSFGGEIIPGLTILTAMQLFKNAGGIIETVNECCADSTAGWVFAAGTKGRRKIMQFSSIMTHPPMFEDGRTLADIPEGSPDFIALNSAFQKIIDIFVPITGLSQIEVREMMLKETDMDADAAILNGLADKKILISNAPALKNNLTRKEMVNVTSGLIFNVKKEINKPVVAINSIKMKKVAILLNLNSEASEEAIAKAVEAAMNARKTAEDALQVVNSKHEVMKAELTNLKIEVSANKDKAITNYIDEIIKADPTKKDSKENLVNMAKSVGLDAFKDVVSVKAVKAAVIDQNIDEQNNADEDVAGIALAKEFKALNHSAKQELKRVNSAKYQTLVDAYDKHAHKII